MRGTTLLAFLTACLFGLSGCSKSVDTAAPAGSTISITSISPPAEQLLVVGSKVKLRITVAYWLAADSGSVSLVVQSADTSSVAQDERVVKKGGGELIFENEFVVPDTKTLRVFVPLSGGDQTATSTLDTRAYTVGK